jgi:CubicO group peptidase (beta-lactamase class C family)
MFVSFMAGHVSLLHGQSANLQKEIGKIIRNEAQIDFKLVPGVLIGVWDQDSTYTFSIGEKQNKYDSYEMGGVTKPVVAWLAAKALDSLGWSMETKICEFMPVYLCQNGWEEITIEEALAHRTGLMKLPPGLGEAEVNIDDPYFAYSLEAFAQDIPLMNPESGSYSYSHVNYILLYWLFDRVGGLDDFMDRKLIRPMSWLQTGFQIPDDRLASGHDRNGVITEPWHCNAFTPALGLRSGVLDMLEFIRQVSPELLIHAPEWTESAQKIAYRQMKKGTYDIVDGWFLLPDKDAWVFYHNGFSGGHCVSVAFMPQRQKGVVVIGNGTIGTGELSLLVLEMLIKSKRKK